MLFRSAKNKFEAADIMRRLKRFAEGTVSSYRRLFLMLLCVCIIFYMLPPIFRYLFLSAPQQKDPHSMCMDDRLTPYILQNYEYDANIRHVPPLLSDERDYLPYIGNGYIGLEVSSDAALNIKHGRAMQLPIRFQPVLSVAQNSGAPVEKEATVVEYLTGMVHRFQCLAGYFVSYTMYAHRTQPSVLMQELQITNTRNVVEDVDLMLPRSRLPKSTTRSLALSEPAQLGMFTYNALDVVTGTVQPSIEDPSKQIVVSIVKPKLEPKLQLRKRGTVRIIYPLVINYSKPVTDAQLKNTIDSLEQRSIQTMTNLLQKLSAKASGSGTLHSINTYRQEHINVWNDLWATGFTISSSKAENSLNGDRINATMYAVLSQVRSFEFEDLGAGAGTPALREDIAKALTYAEGCYDSYHTLQAENLWRDMTTLHQLNTLVSSWMLTLEKQGCHHLIRAGASGVIQAMTLSFGSFRFSNQHLECNMHPKFLHRDFHFRRLNYGNKTHVNVTIIVKEDNKAVINVALDRSDRSYYACDGGCLDEPVLLTQNRREFPVKLTEPLTAILYITEDKQHMEEIHHAIHVKEVVEGMMFS
ncbi:CG7289 [Drosophila busckii]|uniref:CG7289 n=1 Tax=Drosophila busckii TaxID=30019 RepID=A0A0M5J3B1_DROBS|nr:CG7289 [Drosophila busckii]